MSSYCENDKTNKISNNIDLPQIIRSIALIYTDDKLDPEVEKFINHKPEVIWKDNAYVYLWGMNVKTDNAYKTGKEILVQLLEEDSLYAYEQHPLELGFLNDYPLYKSLENDLLCKKHKKGCIEKIIHDNQNARSLLITYGFYTSRYLKFLSYNQYKQIADRRFESAIPRFKTLSNAQKIYHIYILQELKKTTNTKRTKQLTNELIQLKSFLKHADSIIAKMIAASLINENIELFNYLYQKGYTSLSQNEYSSTIFKLSTSEMSIYNAMYEEQSRDLKMLFDWTSDYKTLTKKVKNPLADGIMRILFYIVSKPNLTVNTQPCPI